MESDPLVRHLRFPDWKALVQDETFLGLPDDHSVIWRGQAHGGAGPAALTPAAYRPGGPFTHGRDDEHPDVMQNELLERCWRVLCQEHAPLLIKMAACQHLGIPTACLDWTRSRWIGLFFSAFDCTPQHHDKETGRPVRKLRHLFAMKSRDVLPSDPIDRLRPDSLTMIELARISDELSLLTKSGEVWRERARAQKGVLVAVGQWSSDISVEQHLIRERAALRGFEPVLYKFEYPEDSIHDRSDLLSWLFMERGIDSTTLFPNFQGLVLDFRLQAMLTGYKGMRR